jgi:GNAT superfamily N-acetyltransferase
VEIQVITNQLAKFLFDCGESSLNDYFHLFAVKNTELNIGRTYVACTDCAVAGYFTVSTAQVLYDEIPEKIRRKLSRYSVPAFRIGRLAVAKEYQGKGVENYLLQKALCLAVRISVTAAVHVVIIDALNKEVVSFYTKYGFMQLPSHPLMLFLPVQTIARAVTSGTFAPA